MHPLDVPTGEEFRRGLRPAVINFIRMMQLATAAGALILLAIMIYFEAFHPAPAAVRTDHETTSLIIILTVVTLVATFGAFALGHRIALKIALSAAEAPATPVEIFKKWRLLYLVLAESAALLVFTVCVVASQQGVLKRAPLFSINPAPIFLLLYFNVRNFASENRAAADFHTYLRPHLLSGRAGMRFPVDDDRFCKRCRHYAFDAARGILRGLSHDKPSFRGNYRDFVLDPEQQRRLKAEGKRLEARRRRLDDYKSHLA